MSIQHESHGHSVAAWVCVSILMLAAAIGSWAVVVVSSTLGIVAVVVTIVGLIAGKVLAATGYGAAGQAGH